MVFFAKRLPRSKVFPIPSFGQILKQVEEDEAEPYELEEVGQQGERSQVL
jgi:hypothetical protein